MQGLPGAETCLFVPTRPVPEIPQLPAPAAAPSGVGLRGERRVAARGSRVHKGGAALLALRCLQLPSRSHTGVHADASEPDFTILGPLSDFMAGLTASHLPDTVTIIWKILVARSPEWRALLGSTENEPFRQVGRSPLWMIKGIQRERKGKEQKATSFCLRSTMCQAFWWEFPHTLFNLI